MRLPFLQVSQKAFGDAKVLGRLLGVSRHDALGRMVALWATIIDRTPEGTPPEEMGLVTGPDAALVIAAGADWEGDPETLARSMCTAGFAEVAPGGWRVKGVPERYAGAMATPEERSERAARAAKVRWEKERTARAADERARTMLNDAQRMLGACSEHAPSMLDACSGDAERMLKHAQTQTHTHIPPSEGAAGATPPETPGEVLTLLPTEAPKRGRARKERTPSARERFRDFFQELRCEHIRAMGGAGEPEADWDNARANTQLAWIDGHSDELLTEAVGCYLDDASEGGPSSARVPWPLAWFVKKRAQYLEEAHARLRARTPAEEAAP